jgi:serine/threonine protein kinase
MVAGQFPWHESNTGIMLRQILKASYTVPDFVSPQCKDLISSILKRDPQDRLAIEGILDHPWLKLADVANEATEVPFEPVRDAAALPQ